MGRHKKLMPVLLRMEPNTRKQILIGRTRVSVDKEEDGSFTVVVPGCMPCKYGRAYEAAVHLRTLALLTTPRRD